MSKLAIFKIFKPSVWRSVKPLKRGLWQRIKRGGAAAWGRIRNFTANNPILTGTLAGGAAVAFVNKLTRNVADVNMELNQKMKAQGFESTQMNEYRAGKMKHAFQRMEALIPYLHNNSQEGKWLEFIFCYHEVLNQFTNEDLADFAQSANNTVSGLRSCGLTLEDKPSDSHVVSAFRKLKDGEPTVAEDVQDLMSVIYVDSEMQLPLEACP